MMITKTSTLYKWKQSADMFNQWCAPLMGAVKKAIFHTLATVASVNTGGEKSAWHFTSVSQATFLSRQSSEGEYPWEQHTLLSPPLYHMLGIELLLFSLFDCYLCFPPPLCMCIWTAWFVINQAVMLECLHLISTGILIKLIFLFALLCLTICTIVNICHQFYVIIYIPSCHLYFK